MSARLVYRWEFRAPSVARRIFVELELHELRGDSYAAEVWLVRDEAHPPTPKDDYDPERRVGQRVYAGVKVDDECRMLMFLAPKEGERRAYSLIWQVLKEHQDAVRGFGDDWLTETICGKAGDTASADALNNDRKPSA